MEGSLGEIISRAPKMSPVEEKSSLASVQEDLHDYLTPGESRLLVAVEKNPLDYDSWMELLDVTEREGSHEKVVRLYERCLVPCAACADIWMRYVDFLEEAKMLTDASAVLSRALCFVEREEQLEFCLFSARYKERIGDISGARQQYHEILSKLSPGSLEVLEAHANMERRLGDDEKALKDPLKFALKDPHKSRQILSELDGLNLTHAVIKAVINLASSFALNKDILLLEFIDSLVQKFLFSNLNDGSISTESERRDISMIYFEFLDMFGDISSIQVAFNRHFSMFREGPFISSKKRALSEINRD